MWGIDGQPGGRRCCCGPCAFYSTLGLNPAHTRRIAAMSTEAASFLAAFDALPPDTRHEVALQILRRDAIAASHRFGPLTDDELVAMAAERFAELDQRESHGG